jgi:hypothetical protein
VDTENEQQSRSILPIPDVPPVSLTTYDAKDPDTKYPPIAPLRPPAGASNVLIVLLDDVGFGASSAFGGPINTPTAERLAANGLKYNRSITLRCARRRARQCFRAATIKLSEWVRSRRWRPARRDRRRVRTNPRRSRAREPFFSPHQAA